MSNPEILSQVIEIITPYNKKGLTVTGSTTFASDLELDSLTVMDMVADFEDDFDILLPLNILPDLETVADVAKAIEDILKKG